MATSIHSGSQGTVYIGSTAVASIRSFSLEETQETIDATTMNVAGTAFRTNKATFQSWSATIDVFWTVDDDYADALTADVGEANSTLKPGTNEYTFHFWPTGDDQYELGYTGNGLVTGRTISSSVDGMVEASITVLGTSAITTENGTA
jgi:hypothetical protein